MKTEKVSINLSPTELGQIDLLVERGAFDNRSDFMRAAARKALEGYEGSVKHFLYPEHLNEESKYTLLCALGVAELTRGQISLCISQGKKMHIRVVGMLKVSDGINPGDIRTVVESCKIHGKIIATDEVKVVLLELENG